MNNLGTLFYTTLRCENLYRIGPRSNLGGSLGGLFSVTCAAASPVKKKRETKQLPQLLNYPLTNSLSLSVSLSLSLSLSLSVSVSLSVSLSLSLSLSLYVSVSLSLFSTTFSCVV